MFGKKSCPKCNEKVKNSYGFCPFCGHNQSNSEKDMRDYGMLGKNDGVEGFPMVGGGNMGFSEKMIGSLMNNLFKALDKEMKSTLRDNGEESNVETLPNGIRIHFGVPKQVEPKRKQIRANNVTADQVKKMSGLPRTEAKTSVRRLSDKVVYELDAPGIESVQDVFVSKVESGYEVKAIGKKKVYINNLPVNLPLKGYAINTKGLTVEFGLQ